MSLKRCVYKKQVNEPNASRDASPDGAFASANGPSASYFGRMPERDSPRSSPEIATAIAEAMADPIRVQVAYALRVTPGLTVRQIADRTGEPPRSVRYQLTVLRRSGLVEISDQGTRRGAIEHRYSLTRPLLLTEEELDSLPAPLSRRISLEILGRFLADVEAATRQGTFGSRSSQQDAQMFGTVDETGWSALVEISVRYIEEAQQVLREAETRIDGSRETTFPITAALFLFEGPNRPSAPPPD
jgi:DNA-binding transcriptional ArsR family regulator